MSESHFILRPSDQSSCVVAINIVDDLALEVTESLTVSLSLTEDLDGVLISQPTATILIIDDDGKANNGFIIYSNYICMGSRKDLTTDLYDYRCCGWTQSKQLHCNGECRVISGVYCFARSIGY